MKFTQNVKNTSVLAILTASICISILFNNKQSIGQPQRLIAQASKTQRFVVNEFGYSFEIPNWTRVIKNGNKLEIMTQSNYEFRQRGNQCQLLNSKKAGCPDISITIEGNGRNKLEEKHKRSTTPPSSLEEYYRYKGKVTVNGRTYRKYEIGDEAESLNTYLYLTKDNHLVSIDVWNEPYKGDRNALVMILGSFKE